MKPAAPHVCTASWSIGIRAAGESAFLLAGKRPQIPNLQELAAALDGLGGMEQLSVELQEIGTVGFEPGRSKGAFVRHRIDPHRPHGLRLTLFVVSAGLAGIPFAFLLAEVASKGPLVGFDHSVAKRIGEEMARHPVLSKVFRDVSFLGFPPWFWALVGGVTIYLSIRGKRRLVAFLLSSTLGGSIIDTVVKLGINRPRPLASSFEDGHSFPSGHSMSSTIAYGALLVIFLPLIPRRWRPAAIIGTVMLVLSIGVARLGLGVHYLSDVLAGYVLGLAWLATTSAAYRIWDSELLRPPE
jgi:membrane-associated phospholipid phosphatase